MNTYRITFIVAFSFLFISSCDSGIDQKTLIELQNPDHHRQILSIDDNRWRVDIVLNSSDTTQTFYFGDSTTASASVSGVMLGKINFIEIVWHEILNGHEIEMTKQSQQFVADGATQINAPHTHQQFDYDGDLTSNLDERMTGTCVWSSSERCINTGQPDIPPEPSAFSILINDDFTNGSNSWWVNSNQTNVVNGEYCIGSLQDRLDVTEADTFYRNLFSMEPGRYEIEFDVHSPVTSNIILYLSSISDGNLITVEKRTILTGTRHSQTFINGSERAINNIMLGFRMGDGVNNVYCIDNVTVTLDAS